MTDVVFAHDGTVPKVVGDALHVLFGAPGEQPDHAARSVACALALDAFAEGFRARWAAAGVTLGATRIGVHAGLSRCTRHRDCRQPIMRAWAAASLAVIVRPVDID